MCKGFLIHFIEKVNRAFDLQERNRGIVSTETEGSIQNLKFDGMEQSKKFMREDMANFGNDFKKATKEAQAKVDVCFNGQ